MSSSRLSRVLLWVVFVGAAWAGVSLVRGDAEGPPSAPRSSPGEAGSPEGEAATRTPSGPGPSGPPLPAGEVCPGGGYLCASLSERDTLRVARFADDTGTLTVRVLEPEAENAARARRLQRAAIRGIQAWQGHPFALRIDERGLTGPPDLEVRWVAQIEGTVLGRTRSSFRSGPRGVEYRAVELTLSTRVPGRPERPLPLETVELTAAHEMGHVLGLPHSDHPRDLMYPENTSTHPTARDYRTLQALYGIPNGARIVATP